MRKDKAIDLFQSKGMFGAVVPHVIILQRGPRNSAVKGARAPQVLFSALSLESRSLPVSRPRAILKQPLSTWGKLFMAQHKAGLLHLRGARGQPGSLCRAHLLSCFCSLRTQSGPVLLHFQSTCSSWWWDRHQRSCGAACELCLACGCPGEGVSIPWLAGWHVLLSCSAVGFKGGEWSSEPAQRAGQSCEPAPPTFRGRCGLLDSWCGLLDSCCAWLISPGWPG